jgi:hypothetical protein
LQSNEGQATNDSKLKLFAFSTKSTNITAQYTQTERKKNEKVGYAVVLSENTIKRRQFPQNLIYSAEQSAIINAIYSTASYNQKRVIIIDSLSIIIAVSDRKRYKNPKTQLIPERVQNTPHNEHKHQNDDQTRAVFHKPLTYWLYQSQPSCSDVQRTQPGMTFLHSKSYHRPHSMTL